ncbi:MAG: 50S ribosomal protein L15 [Phycisphaera sp.]|nr:50S ribosomal protein L15 [Phycisphaera sp.]
MMIHEITEKVGKKKHKKRIGRGIGSGHGKTSGRGTKGAGSRSGWTGSIRASREGGQMPLFRRVPKRGFSNFNFRTEYMVVNLKALDARFEDGAEVNAEMLVKVGLVPDTTMPIKVLGEGELKKKLTVTAAAFSASAKDKIEKAGGTATVAK